MNRKERLQNLLPKTKNLKVLYVEDHDLVREETKKLLNFFFDDIMIAIDGQIGFELSKSREFDLIISDIEMPNLDGISMIKLIREYNKDIPVIIFSAYSNTEYLMQAIDIGISGYMIKPYNTDELIDIISKIVIKNDLIKNTKKYINLRHNFKWNNKNSILLKDDLEIKLTKNEIELFNLFINSDKSSLSYQMIEEHIFDDYNGDNKRSRNLISRLKNKLEFNLFEGIYSYGYKINYEE